jgi:transcriptional regulator with XRE-family HTH domain
MEYSSDVFAERLKQMRKERGLSQQALGDKIGVTKATISKYENRVNPPKLVHAKALADALSVSFNYLIGFSEYKYKIEAQHISDIYMMLSDGAKKELYNYAEYLRRKEQEQ